MIWIGTDLEPCPFETVATAIRAVLLIPQPRNRAKQMHRQGQGPPEEVFDDVVDLGGEQQHCQQQFDDQSNSGESPAHRTDSASQLTGQQSDEQGNSTAFSPLWGPGVGRPSDCQAPSNLSLDDGDYDTMVMDPTRGSMAGPLHSNEDLTSSPPHRLPRPRPSIDDGPRKAIRSSYHGGKRASIVKGAIQYIDDCAPQHPLSTFIARAITTQRFLRLRQTAR
ncbi:unnamed protein product [Sympodiomycopsis kandeliae]